jgi:hypothetical protein
VVVEDRYSAIFKLAAVSARMPVEGDLGASPVASAEPGPTPVATFPER